MTNRNIINEGSDYLLRMGLQPQEDSFVPDKFKITLLSDSDINLLQVRDFLPVINKYKKHLIYVGMLAFNRVAQLLETRDLLMPDCLEVYLIYLRAADFFNTALDANKYLPYSQRDAISQATARYILSHFWFDIINSVERSNYEKTG